MSKTATTATVEFVNECLQDYPANLTRMNVLKKDLETLRSQTDVKAQNYVRVYQGDRDRTPGDPVSEYVQKIEKLEKEIDTLRRITEPITRMIQDLKSPYALEVSLNSDFIKILGLHYFGRNPLPIILNTTGWSRASFFRKKKQLIKLAKSYLGY